MGGLTGFIKGLFIDDYLSLMELENMLVNRDIRPGVFSYSTNLRNLNITSNYNGGSNFRSNTGETYSYYLNAETGRLEKPSIKTDDVGASANIDFYKNNSNLNFVTQDEFVNFSNLIRQKNIDFRRARVTEENDYSQDENHVKAKIENYMDYFQSLIGIDTKYSNSNYGDLYVKDDVNVIEKMPSKDKSLSFIGNHIRDWLNVNGFTNFDYAKIKNSDVKKYMDVFDTSYSRGVSFSNSNYGDLYEKDDVNINRGLYSSVDIIGKIVRNGELKFSLNLGLNTKENQYAFEDIPDFIFDPGSVRRKSEYSENIVTKNNGGSLSQYNEKTNSRTYTYYQENDDGKAVTNINQSDAIFNANVEIGNFEGTSDLLTKTNELFRNKKIKSLVNRFKTGGLDTINKELETSYSQYGLSRGRNLLSKGSDSETGFSNPYCRVWTAANQYSKLKHRIRPFYNIDGGVIGISELQSSFGDLRPNNGGERLEKYGVLKNNGFVKISPEHKDGVLSDNRIKKYMFSIENLAWRDVITTAGLSEEQKGPNNGRIMWFPPYNLKFTENVNVEWNSNKFIGRGEQIYTYTNTDRSGTLSFTLLIDHPSILNKWRTMSDSVDKDPYENDVLRFFAGCSPLNGNAAGEQQDETPDREHVPTSTPKQGKQPKTYAYVVFFPNNYSGKNDGVDQMVDVLSRYETTYSEIINNVDSDFSGHTAYSANTSEYSLNNNPSSDIMDKIKNSLLNDEGDLSTGDDDAPLVIIPLFNSESGLTSLAELITNEKIFGNDVGECKIEKIRVKGFASSHGNTSSGGVERNENLALRRAQMIVSMVKNYCYELLDPNLYQLDGTDVIEIGESNSDDSINALDAKIARSAVLMIDVTWKDNVRATSSVEYGEDGEEITTAFEQEYEEDPNIDPNPQDLKIASETEEVQTPSYKYDNEYLYFSEIVGDDLVYKSIVDKVRYFSPAFHSITPEGFNSRLTFLQQCTRQGPTLSRSGGRVNTDSSDYLKYGGNLSFGRPPYCVLRIGDFFHTKICITSLSIDYDNGGGLQWDLNPEGIGVQPMFANININFNFIGGQDIAGPVERLQNAVSYNYYANASIYDSKADVGSIINGTEEGPSKVPYDPFNGEEVDYYSND